MLLAGAFLTNGLTLAQQASSISQQSVRPAKRPVQAQPSNTAGSRPSGIPPGADVEELAYVVLMNATNDQDQDLKEIASEVQQAAKAQELAKLQQAKLRGLSVYKPAKSPKKSAKRNGSAAHAQKSSGVKQSH
jgi:hypothetical protein